MWVHLCGVWWHCVGTLVWCVVALWCVVTLVCGDAVWYVVTLCGMWWHCVVCGDTVWCVVGPCGTL